MEKKLLILDIDETLIHCVNKKDKNIKYDFSFIIENFCYYGLKRPGLKNFLEFVKKNFRIAFWSSGGKDYVYKIISIIAPNIDAEFIWCYDKCTIKSLKLLNGLFVDQAIKRIVKVWKNKSLNASKNSTLILDDSRINHKENYNNSIIIKKFLGENTDNEFEKIIVLLDKLRSCEDVTKIDKKI